MRGWLGGLVLMLAAATLATPALAQVGDETGEKLGPLQAPAGGKAYRVSWHGYWNGYVEATVDAAGKVRMRKGAPGAPAIDVPLQPGDLAAFERELARSAFAQTPAPTGRFASGCLDACSDYFLTVASDGAAKTLHATSGLGDVADELIEIADARSGDHRGRPAPWWTHDRLDRPGPPLTEVHGIDCATADAGCARVAWRGLLAGLGLQDLSGDPNTGERRLYRLVWMPERGPAAAVVASRGESPCGYWIQGPGTDCREPTFLSTALRPKRRKASPETIDRIEAALYAAGFSTMPANPQTRCSTGDHWVLEAYVYRRYRYVAGSSCDARGLDEPIAQLRRWAR